MALCSATMGGSYFVSYIAKGHFTSTSDEGIKVNAKATVIAIVLLLISASTIVVTFVIKHFYYRFITAIKDL